jgi:hypothetical protein
MYLDAEFHKKHFSRPGTKAHDIGLFETVRLQCLKYLPLHPIFGVVRTFLPVRSSNLLN